MWPEARSPTSRISSPNRLAFEISVWDGGGAADGTVAANLYYNPANLISLGGFEIAGETQNWFGEVDFYNFGGASRFRVGDGAKKIHIGVGLWYARQENVDVTVMSQGDGSTLETTDSYLNLALALGVRTERFEIGMGGAVKPVWIEFASVDEKVTAWAFDVGFKFGGLLVEKNGHAFTGSAGSSILNAGQDAKGDKAFSELPTEIRAGVAVCYKTPVINTRGQNQVPALALFLNAEIVDRSLQREIQADTGSLNPPFASLIGAEACLINVFNLRIGWLDDGIAGHVLSGTYGIGLQFANEKFRFALDLAHLSEIVPDGPSVTSSGLSMAWFF